MKTHSRPISATNKIEIISIPSFPMQEATSPKKVIPLHGPTESCEATGRRETTGRRPNINRLM